ncbi:hypothetical protein Cgig2_002532 [Carnegiea gigantea]|uniref:Protein arginine N-methyltransferase domain-containing protein n=1 Tax=Carnegiea gigantea TaxID=171969 RepID=A0A9Q1QR93_9CARY|nr:hypothetical protein Cgig2_002532 [Carnegiea gigantea]
MASILAKTLTHPLCTRPRRHLNHHSLTYINFRPARAMSSSGSNQRMFQLKFDPLTGNSEWVVVDEIETDDASNPTQSSTVDLATTSYLDMLNDTSRNKAYRLAIDKTVTRQCHVLDIGAGTGLLSMMAARAMGTADRADNGDAKGQVTACESYLPMVKLMRKVLRCNGMERRINVINKRSDELKVGVDISTRADILVSEILDSELLGEGLIPTLQNAHDELLVENAQTVPYRATTYGQANIQGSEVITFQRCKDSSIEQIIWKHQDEEGRRGQLILSTSNIAQFGFQLVESTFLWRLHDLYNNEIFSSDTIQLVPTKLASILRVKAQQYPMHCDSLQEEIKLLSEPFKIFEFEFWKRPDSHGKAEQLVKATADGRVNAVVSWWVLQLDQEGTIFYSTAPKWIKRLQPNFPDDGNWCDHWKQCVWFVPGKGLLVCKDEDIHLDAVHSDISISYDLKVQNQKTDAGHRFDNQDFQLILSPERIATYSDNYWRRCVLSAVQNALQRKDAHLCYVADDSIFLATAISHLCRTSQIVVSFPGLQEKGLHYLQTIAEANGFSVDRLKLQNHQKDSTIMHDTDAKKVDLLVGEPFYYGCEAQLPWKNLRFWKERTKLEGILSKDAQIIPYKGILRACAMFLPDLWRSRRALENIEGFDHSVVNATLGACGNLRPPLEGPISPFFVWQCGETKELSERFTLMEFDFSKPMSSCSGKAKVQFAKTGVCHGFALWIDWVLDTESGILVSTGPDSRYWKQGVKLLANPVSIGSRDLLHSDEYHCVEIDATFDSSSGDLMVRDSFLR